MKDFLVAALTVVGLILLMSEDTGFLPIGVFLMGCAIYSVKDDL